MEMQKLKLIFQDKVVYDDQGFFLTKKVDTRQGIQIQISVGKQSMSSLGVSTSNSHDFLKLFIYLFLLTKWLIYHVVLVSSTTKVIQLHTYISILIVFSIIGYYRNIDHDFTML